MTRSRKITPLEPEVTYRDLTPQEIKDRAVYAPPSCSTCHFWLPIDEPSLRTTNLGKSSYSVVEFVGECRRRPPLADPADHLAYWPTTDHYGWCGEYKQCPPRPLD